MLTKTTQRLQSAWRVLLHGETPRSTGREVPAITQAEVAEARTFFPAEKFFIYGHARSGTTLLTRLVRLHPEVHCNYQAHFFTRAPLLEGLVVAPDIASWLGRNSNRWNHGRDLSPVVLRAVSDYIICL
ncbi:MAG TPA: sulfotransferase, partial [Anaerolineales bacterium]|nr:sulfotransferase [Anaerolineales bacterium]